MSGVQSLFGYLKKTLQLFTSSAKLVEVNKLFQDLERFCSLSLKFLTDN